MSAKRKLPAEAVASKSAKANVNTDICDFLNKLADHEKNVTRNIHKHNAYRKAARSIAASSDKITTGKQATKLEGVGKKIAEKIDEFISTGKLSKLEKIAADPKAQAIQLIASVVGFGPAAARAFVDKGVTTLAELKEQPKLSNTQKLGLKHYDDFNLRIPRAEMLALRTAALASIAAVDSKLSGEVCGSFRRGAASSGDIDILLTHHEHAARIHVVVCSFTSSGDGEAIGKAKHKPAARFRSMLQSVVTQLQHDNIVTDTLSLGEFKFMGVARLPASENESEERHFRRIDIRFLPIDQYPLALLYFTGSDETNKQMRRKAIDLNMKLSEYSLRPIGEGGKMGKPVDISSEKDVFEALGMPYKEPSER